ncbi:MAG: prolipoprotein diacylglyceryl transferase [Oscillospiraceae bacterium]
MYNLFIALGFLFGVIYVLLYAKKYELKKIRALLFVGICYATLYLLMLLLYFLISGKLAGKNMVRVFAFCPIVVTFFAIGFNIDVKKAFDFLAPVPLLVFAITHIGCNWGGCCRSNITVPWGIYNRITQTHLFPNQILETIVAALSTVLILYLLHKNKYDMGGKAMGYMLILYGSQRFLLEFIRDNQKLFWGISELALWALATIIVGLVLNFIVLRKKVAVDTQQTISDNTFIIEKENEK